MGKGRNQKTLLSMSPSPGLVGLTPPTSPNQTSSSHTPCVCSISTMPCGDGYTSESSSVTMMTTSGNTGDAIVGSGSLRVRLYPCRQCQISRDYGVTREVNTALQDWTAGKKARKYVKREVFSSVGVIDLTRPLVLRQLNTRHFQCFGQSILFCFCFRRYL